MSTGTGADQCLGDLQWPAHRYPAGIPAGSRCPRPGRPWHRLGSSACSTSMNTAEPPRFWAFCHNMQCNGGFTAAFRPIDLDDTPLGDTTDAQRNIQRQTAGGNGLYIQCGMLAQTHHRTLAKLLFDLSQCGIQCLLLFRSNRCVLIFRLLNSHIKTSVFAKNPIRCPVRQQKKRGHLPGRLPWKRAHELTIFIIAFPTAKINRRPSFFSNITNICSHFTKNA